MAGIGGGVKAGLLSRFLGRLRFPQAFTLLLALFAVDFFFVDPIPFLDEIVLGILTLMLGMWKERGTEIGLDAPPPQEKNVTDRSSRF